MVPPNRLPGAMCHRERSGFPPRCGRPSNPLPRPFGHSRDNRPQSNSHPHPPIRPHLVPHISRYRRDRQVNQYPGNQCPAIRPQDRNRRLGPLSRHKADTVDLPAWCSLLAPPRHNSRHTNSQFILPSRLVRRRVVMLPPRRARRRLSPAAILRHISSRSLPSTLRSNPR
jgi:hypothetical protein